jgi:3-oxoacyl-[acyl-carrier protein] reductase
MTPPLAGRTAIVTGAGSPDGIGIACARALLDLGATVRIAATTDRVHDRAAQLGHGVVGIVGDLTVEEDVRALVDAAGPVDVLVNNAGMTSVTAPDVLASVTTLSAEDWDADLARNLRTAFLVTRASLPGMVDRGWGRVVNVASTTGPVNAMPEQASYAAARPAWSGSRARSPSRSRLPA